MQYLIICIESNCNHNSPSNLSYRWVLSMLVNGLQNLNPLIIGLNDQKSLLKIVVSLSKSSLRSHLIIVPGFYSWSANNNLGNTSNHSFETRPGGSTRDLADPGLEPGRVKEKIRERKTRCDLAGWPGQKPGCNMLTFVFLLKWRHFDFKKNWPGRPVKTRNPGLGPDRVWKLCFK